MYLCAQVLPHSTVYTLSYIRIFNSSSVNLAPFTATGFAASFRTSLDECESVSRNAVNGPTFLGFGTGLVCCCGFLSAESCCNSSALQQKKYHMI